MAVREAALATALSERVTEVTAEVLRRLADAFGPHGLAVEGSAATLAALSAGRVATLVVAGSASGQAWFADDLLGSDLRPAAGLVTHGDLVDVAVRAALLTDAQVVVLPEGSDPSYPAEGIGALCRYPA